MSGHELQESDRILFYFLAAIIMLVGGLLCAAHAFDMYRTYETTGKLVKTRETTETIRRGTQLRGLTVGKVKYLGPDKREYFVSERLEGATVEGDSVKIRVYKSRPSKAYFVRSYHWFNLGIFLVISMAILIWKLGWIINKFG